MPSFISGGLLPNKLKGKSYDGLVHITDFYKTTMDYADVSDDDLLLDGVSLRTLLESPGRNIQHDRDRFIITADEVGCNATYGTGEDETPVCGGIIRDFGSDGIWKLVIGSEALTGTKGKFGWGELDNQDKVNDYANETLGLPRQIICDPNDLGLVKPTYNNVFKSSDCGPNNLPCLYKLTDDPCEIENKAEDSASSVYLEALMNELIAAYQAQADPFWTREDCKQADPAEIFEEMERIGYWNPFQEWFTKDSQYSQANTDEYLGVCSPTAAPTQEPTTPTLPPTTGTPTKELLYEYVSSADSYGQAKAYCDNTYSTSLATITTQEERDAAIDIIGDEQVWIGLESDDNGVSWEFNDGTSCPTGDDDCIDFWNSGYPSGSVQCAYFDGEEDYVSNDISCGTSKPFLCNRPPVTVIGGP